MPVLAVIFSRAGPEMSSMKSELTENKMRVIPQYCDGALAPRNRIGHAERRDGGYLYTRPTWSSPNTATSRMLDRAAESCDEEIELTKQSGDPLLIHTEPGADGHAYGVCTVLVPMADARLTRNGVETSAVCGQ